MGTINFESELRDALEKAWQAGYTQGESDSRNAIVRALTHLTSADGSRFTLDTSTGDMGLSERPRNCLYRAGITTIGELTQKREEDLLAITHFGYKALEEVKSVLAQHGFSLSD